MLHCYAPKWANVEDEVLQLIISSRNSSDPCIYQMQRGLEVLGMLSALTEFPMLHYLLRPTAQHKLNVAKLLHILKPEFSPEGSNSLVKEKETYQAFVRYTRDVAASRRVCGNFTLNLGHILQFTTGASEEPVLGFIHPPSLHFILPCASALRGVIPQKLVFSLCTHMQQYSGVTKGNCGTSTIFYRHCGQNLGRSMEVTEGVVSLR